MRDFTRSKYGEMLRAFRDRGYSFITYSESLNYKSGHWVILRHDVDKKPVNALKLALMENEMGIKGSYYFRAVDKEREQDFVKAIGRLGHETGYHYEDLSAASGNSERAIRTFGENLAYFRAINTVTTICMHGDPLSAYDNRMLWQGYDYRTFDIEGEPYFDMDVTRVLYISDTGRRWDSKASVRDRAGLMNKRGTVPGWDTWKSVPLDKSLVRIGKGAGALHELFDFHSTDDIIKALFAGRMPDRIMINIHPQRWEDSYVKWMSEIVTQNLKNVVKKILSYRYAR